VRPLTDDPGRFARVSDCVLWDAARDRREPCRIRAARVHGDVVLVTLEGCDTVTAAQGLAGRLLALPEREALIPAEGRFYPWQLEGCRVVTEEGMDVGTVSGVQPSPAHDLWVVRQGAREHLIPAVPAIVVDVSLAERRVVIRPPEGLLDL